MIIVFVGAGNLATPLSLEMQRVGMTIGQVYSRTADSAELLAKKLNCSWTTKPEEIRSDADLYVFALKDTALSSVISKVRPNDGLWVHTAGSMPMNVFKGYAKRYGVLYPLQTFSKGRTISSDKIPFFLEAQTEEDMKVLKKVASALSKNVQELSSDEQKSLHLAAVFACNFSNHMYVLAGKILEEQDIPVKVLQPLIEETAAKLNSMTPEMAQTGPAVRYDKDVINRQLDMLTDPDMKEIYQLLSDSIHKEASGNE